MIFTAPQRVVIFDTTLRDGEQAAGAAMTHRQKLKIARLLEEAGVDVIEAGFPASSEAAYAAVSAIAKRSNQATVCALARGTEGDIKTAAAALAPAGDRARIHVFIATDKDHMAKKLRFTPAEVLSAITRSVRQACSLVREVEFTPEVATTTDFDFLCASVATAIAAGATIINIADTTGHSFPFEYGELFTRLQATVPKCRDVVLSTHCHDDRGCATANTLAGVLAGARQVECTINGIGERAGNAALEEVVMALALRPDVFGVAHGMDTTRLLTLSRVVARASGIVVQPNKAFVGRNAFAHESGIHQAGVLASSSLYEICPPALVGHSTWLPVSKISGKKGIEASLNRLGYRAREHELTALYLACMEVVVDRKQVADSFIRDYAHNNNFLLL